MFGAANEQVQSNARDKNVAAVFMRTDKDIIGLTVDYCTQQQEHLSGRSRCLAAYRGNVKFVTRPHGATRRDWGMGTRRFVGI